MRAGEFSIPTKGEIWVPLDKRASKYRLYSYKGVANILATGADRLDASKNATALPPIVHDNIRGPGYYH